MDAATRQIRLINAAHYFTHYCLLILPTAVLAMAQPGGMFGESYGPILALATGMFVCYGLFSLPQGWLAVRLGRKALLVAFFMGAGLSMVATGFASGPLTLMLALSATGLFAAIYHPIGTAMLVEAAGDKPGRSIGVNGVFGNIGVASAPVATAFLCQTFGWQAAFIVPGVLCMLGGVLYAREPAFDAHGAAARARAFPDIPKFLVKRALIVLMVIAVVSGFVFNAFTILIPKLMQERLAESPDLLPLVGVLAFAATLCGAVAQFSVGRMIDRTTLKRIFLPLTIVLVPTMLMLAFVQGFAALALAGLTAACVFGQVTLSETMAARYISPALRTKIYSIRFFVGFLGAAAAAPVVGYLHTSTGSLAVVLMVLAGASVVTLLCAVFFPDRREELQPELWAAVAAE